jgi:hypothetical protein
VPLNPCLIVQFIYQTHTHMVQRPILDKLSHPHDKDRMSFGFEGDLGLKKKMEMNHLAKNTLNTFCFYLKNFIFCLKFFFFLSFGGNHGPYQYSQFCFCPHLSRSYLSCSLLLTFYNNYIKDACILLFFVRVV